MDDRRKVKADRRRVNLGQPYEVAWWKAAFGVTKAQLEKAVAAVGVEVKHVRDYFFREKVSAGIEAGLITPIKPKRKARKKAARK